MEILTYSQQMFSLAAEGQTRGVWYFAAMYTIVVCAWSAWFQIRTRSWPSAKGQLAQLGIKKFGATEWATADQEYVGTALYTYLVSGRRYEGFRVSPWIFVVSHNLRFLLDQQQTGIQTFPDGGVKVFYNPRNPKKSYLIVAGKTGLAVTLLLGALPAIFYWMKYHA